MDKAYHRVVCPQLKTNPDSESKYCVVEVKSRRYIEAISFELYADSSVIMHGRNLQTDYILADT